MAEFQAQLSLLLDSDRCLPGSPVGASCLTDADVSSGLSLWHLGVLYSSSRVIDACPESHEVKGVDGCDMPSEPSCAAEAPLLEHLLDGLVTCGTQCGAPGGGGNGTSTDGSGGDISE